MRHIGTNDIETERLFLRRFTVKDAQAMYKNWACDPEVTKFLTWPVHDSVEVSEKILEDWVSQYSKDNYYQWAIVVKENNSEVIGSIAVVSQNESIAMAHIGYCIGKSWWNKGITSEALGAIISYLFDEAGFNRIESRHDPKNPNSGKVMQKCGMKCEGTMRQADWNNQGVCDSTWYAVLATERN